MKVASLKGNNQKSLSMMARLLPQSQPTQNPLLLGNERLYALPRERQHLRELRFVKRLPFRGSLHFHHLVPGCHHKIHVHISAGVLLVTKIKQDFSIHNPHTNRSHKISQRNRSQSPSLHQLLERKSQSNERTRNRSCPRPSIRLNHVAINPDRPLAQSRQICDRT